MRNHIFFLLLSQLSLILCFDCRDISRKLQCIQLEGCVWENDTCFGSYSPACLPPECFYIDTLSTSITDIGTPQNPLRSLPTGFAKSGDRTLIIINYSENVALSMNKAFTLGNAIIVKYFSSLILFDNFQ